MRLRHGFVSPASRWKVCIPGYICLRYCREDSWIPRPQWLASLSTLLSSGCSKNHISKNKGERDQIRHITWASGLHKHTYACTHMCMRIPTWMCTYNTHIYTCKFIHRDPVVKVFSRQVWVLTGVWIFKTHINVKWLGQFTCNCSLRKESWGPRARWLGRLGILGS